MRYHYQKGAILEKEGKGRGKLVLFGIGVFGIGGYVGFLALLPSVGGWILVKNDEVAHKIRTVAPGGDGNYLYIPKINVQVIKGTANASFEGKASETLRVKAAAFSLQVTPRQTLAASPFARLNQLTNGDEIFLDDNGTRYAYKVTGDTAKATLHLETTDGSATVAAEPVGTVAWNGGNPKLQAN